MTRWGMGSITDKVLHMIDHPMLIAWPALGKPIPLEIKFEPSLPLDGSLEAEQATTQGLPLAKAMDLKVAPLAVQRVLK